jgi:hypothetical protein
MPTYFKFSYFFLKYLISYSNPVVYTTKLLKLFILILFFILQFSSLTTKLLKLFILKFKKLLFPVID